MSFVSHSCNAEIGKPGNFRVCCKPAKWSIRSATGAFLHYCEPHKRQRENAPDDRYFRKAPFAEWRELAAQKS